MHWELWALSSGNLIASPDSEDEALALVRELVSKGWRAEDLSLGVEIESLPAEALPPPLEGDALLARARKAPHRRSAWA